MNTENISNPNYSLFIYWRQESRREMIKILAKDNKFYRDYRVAWLLSLLKREFILRKTLKSLKENTVNYY